MGLSPVYFYIEATPIFISWLFSSQPRQSQSKKTKEPVNKSKSGAFEGLGSGLVKAFAGSLPRSMTPLWVLEISALKEDGHLGRGLIASSVSQLDVVTAGTRNEEELVCVARLRQA